MTMKVVLSPIPCFVFLASTLCAFAAGELSNDQFIVKLGEKGRVTVEAKSGPSATFEGRFGVFDTQKDPRLAMRWKDFGNPRPEGVQYNVLCWAPNEKPAPRPAATAKAGHVEDGYDPTTDQNMGSERVVDIFKAAPMTEITATSAKIEGGKVQWTFAENPRFSLEASLEVPQPSGEPLLTFRFVPKEAGWFSVAYLGAPAQSIEKVDSIWQPLIWQEKRFPESSYVTESGRCTLPATTVTTGNTTIAVVADPVELPFQPLPKVANSTFGVAVRNARGEAQPMIFTPILGGVGSKRKAAEALDFRIRLYVGEGGSVDAYEKLARGLYQMRDLRSNGEIGSLNGTIENMIRYAMSKWGKFNSDLRGASYETDVPGSVKNVSSLHPLSVALVTDSPQIFEDRARPMIEYALSRERFLFTTDPSVKGQSASPNLNGPGVPISELTALQEISGGKNPYLVEYAEALLPKERSLNLAVIEKGDVWQNWLAIYRATGDRQWLDKARAGADQYIAGRMGKPEKDFSDSTSRGMFFWTAYAPMFAELYELYELTGEKSYLEASRKAARQFTQFIWMCPVVPEGEVTVNEGGVAPAYRKNDKVIPIPIPEEKAPAWRLSEIGLTPESSGTSKGHRAILPAAHAAYMLRIAEATGDTFLRDIARSAIVGRYRSFPGYHINTARTTVYEKVDFAERPKEELNSTTSLHYNHIWPHIALLIDYLVADVATRTHGAVDFPSRFAEGYAYFQNKIYGDRPGKFFGREAFLWMPAGLLSSSDGEINYLSARGLDGGLYLAFSNQSKTARRTKITVNDKLVKLPGKAVEAILWKAGGEQEKITADPASFEIDVPGESVAAIGFPGLKVEPKFQQALDSSSKAWAKDFARIDFGGTHGMIFDFGDKLRWGYVYLQDREGIAETKLHYSTDGKTWQSMSDVKFPFEFTIPLEAADTALSFKVETVDSTGKSKESEVVKLSQK